MNRRIAAAAVAGSLWLMATAATAPPAAAQTSTVFDAVADAYTDASRPDANYGSRTTLRTDATPVVDAFIRFDVQGVGAVPSATLRVFAETSNASGFEVHVVEDNGWDESSITATSAPAMGPAIAASGPVSGGNAYDLDVSSAVSGDGPVTFALTTTSGTATRYSSREGTNPPQLLAPSPPAAAHFVVSGGGSTYDAVESTLGTAYTGTLKSVVESAVADLPADGGTIAFDSGTFDLGGDILELRDLSDVTFEGQGVDVTVIQNASSAAADTEPFRFTGSSGVVVRDLTVSAGGATRSTSDAIEFDGTSDSLIERVNVISSRSRAIVVDGKDAGTTADGNVVRDCVVDGVPGDGIELLAASGNRVEGCTIANVGGHGVQVNKASASADQPHKQSNDNTLSGNTIDQAGRDGVQVNSGDRNQIVGNTITNSSDDASSRDGIRILSSSSVNCDDNVVDGNVARDDQDPRTQTYGLAITSALCHRTVVTDNDFRFNRVGEIKDLGTATDDGSGGTVPAEPPGEFHANSSRPFSVQLVWDTYADPANVGYTVYRDGEAIAVTGPDENGYLDTTASSAATYGYEVDWFDGDGNHSDRAALTVTTPCWCGDAVPPAFAVAADADAYVDAADPTSNRGSSSSLRVDGSPDVRSYLRFTVQGVTDEIKRATLSVFATSTSGVGFDARSATDSAWDEQTITYANAPDLGDVIGTSDTFDSAGYVDVDVSSLVSDNGTYTIALTGRNPTAINFGSNDWLYRPKLVIETGPPDPPPASGPLFSEDFESGGLAQWTTNRGVVATQDVVRDGAWAGRATGTTAPVYASAWINADDWLAGAHDVTYSLWFNVLSQGANNLYLLQPRSDYDSPVMGVYVTASGKLATRNHGQGGGGSQTSTADVGPGWHHLKVHVVTGDPQDSLIEVWLDDVQVVTRTEPLPADPMTRIEIGNRGNGTFDVAFDGVEVTAP